jgi:hypothetical protein
VRGANLLAWVLFIVLLDACGKDSLLKYDFLKLNKCVINNNIRIIVVVYCITYNSCLSLIEYYTDNMKEVKLGH